MDEMEIQKEKTSKSIQIISALRDELELDIQKQGDSSHELESELIELEKRLSMLETTDKNISLFSPYENKKKEELTIRNRLMQIHESLNEDKQEMEQYSEKKEKYELVLECLYNYFHAIESDLDKEINVKQEEYNGNQILNTQEMERQRIARDLHDSTVQNLTNLVHKTELCLKIFDLDSIRVRLELATMIDEIRSIIDSMRRIINNLRPMSIQDLGLVPTIEKYIGKYMHDNQIQVKFNANIVNERISSVISLSLYRIIQEACNNIAKYAKATTCKITLCTKESNVELTIEDNGIGFDSKNLKSKKSNENNGFGLSIMKERALLLGGTIEIKSKKNKGTLICVSIPY